jgi:site-specific DNA-methyltransferase (adenine-specific)
MPLKIRKQISTSQSTSRLQSAISDSIAQSGVAILPPQDVMNTLLLAHILKMKFDTVMLDPWYNKGFGGIQHNYRAFQLEVISRSGEIADHVFFWGFPEIVATFVEHIPEPLELVCWLTWYYKNNPSVIRGWRSSQNACLHLARNGYTLYPERFLNEKQVALKEKGKLRYMPGPTSVIETSPPDVIEQALLVGFVGRQEQTGHPSQKPFKVYDQLLQMSVSEGGLILDPMCGSGTAGAVAKERGFRALLCDGSEEYTILTEKRLGVTRLNVEPEISQLIEEYKNA